MDELKGDAKGQANFMKFMRDLDASNKRNQISPLIRSIRGRFENALPHIQREAARAERERLTIEFANILSTGCSDAQALAEFSEVLEGRNA